MVEKNHENWPKLNENVAQKKTLQFSRQKKGSLVIVGLPIGNFDDLSVRGLESLKSADLIVCEDTRSAIVLLKNFNLIEKKLISYVGSWNKAILAANTIVEKGGIVALVCDRGMVSVSDPGAKVVRYFRGQSVKIDCVPGPSAVTTAFALTGYFGSFIFHGFLPRKKAEILKLVNGLKNLPYNLIFFESPLRLSASLAALAEILPGCEITIARELTKPFQEILQGKIEDFLAKDLNFKGECVLVVKNYSVQNDFEESL